MFVCSQLTSLMCRHFLVTRWPGDMVTRWHLTPFNPLCKNCDFSLRSSAGGDSCYWAEQWGWGGSMQSDYWLVVLQGGGSWTLIGCLLNKMREKFRKFFRNSQTSGTDTGPPAAPVLLLLLFSHLLITLTFWNLLPSFHFLLLLSDICFSSLTGSVTHRHHHHGWLDRLSELRHLCC